MSYTINEFKTAGETLRVNDLRQALYDAEATLMDKVLVNLQRKEHQISRKVDAKNSRPDVLVINWTVTLRDTWVKPEQEQSGQN
jgi:hypothetical protein